MRRESGQSLIVALGLFALAGVSLFMVLNSHRAVDEKMNLVNAADAAAYSGAQMAARELNFMALSNRAMIANEVAIGHQMAYQAEVDLMAEIMAGGFTGILGEIWNGFIDIFGGDSAVNFGNDLSRSWSGVYMLAVGTQNNQYIRDQATEYEILSGVNGRDPIINTIMESVAAQYLEKNALTNVSIAVNDQDTLEMFSGGEDQAASSAASAARSNPFCSMIMFARPGAQSTNGVFDRLRDNPNDPGDADRLALSQQCRNLGQRGGTLNAEGSLDNAIADGGAFLNMLRASAEEASSADWTLERDADYRILGVRVQRRGESEVVWDATNQQINWRGEDSIRTTGLMSALLFGFNAEVESNARDYANQAGENIGGVVRGMLQTAGLCDNDPSTAAQPCDEISRTYDGVTRYAILNPLMGDSVPVTAFLTQRGNCNDDIGADAEGRRVTGWQDDQARFERSDGRACSGEKELYAYAQARVFYQRPVCDRTSDPNCEMGFDGTAVVREQPNLFNPFWQARLGR